MDLWEFMALFLIFLDPGVIETSREKVFPVKVLIQFLVTIIEVSSNNALKFSYNYLVWEISLLRLKRA